MTPRPPAAAVFILSGLVAAAVPVKAAEPPPWMQSIGDSVECLRSIDANPLFAAVRTRMPTAESMGVSHVDDRAKPTAKEQEILVRYGEAAATCIPQFIDAPSAENDPDPQGAAIAALIVKMWGEQTALLRRLAEGALTWGRYNRETMLLDRNLRRELAAIRKPAAPTVKAPPRDRN